MIPVTAGKRSFLAPAPTRLRAAARATRHARVHNPSCARVSATPRPPNPQAGGSTPSGRATPDHQSGHQLLDNCRGIMPRAAVQRPGEHRIGLRVLRVPPIPSTWVARGGSGAGSPGPAALAPYASRLTGRAPGSYPGQDWVRGPGRVPSRRSSDRKSAGPSHRRSRVRVPSVAPRRRGPMAEGAGLRNPSNHVRIVPTRPRQTHGSDPAG